MLFLILSSLTSAFPSSIGFGESSKIFDPAQDFAFTTGPPAISQFPTVLSNEVLVQKLISTSSVETLKTYLVRMTEFPDRYYTTDNGLASAVWIKDQITALQPLVSQDAVLTVRLFNHSWKQPSVIARYEAKVNNNAPGDIVITGCHIDTLAKGADDAASGTSVIQETLRVLVSQKFIPFRPLEFHFYAAEEVGIRGSNDVAEDYAKRQVKVFNYLNLDQSGFVNAAIASKPEMGIITDYASKEATAFVRLTVSKYTSVSTGGMTIKDDRCGYACTDNSAWFKRGYNANLVAESSFKYGFKDNDRVNSDGSALDTVARLDFPHIMEFVKNTIGVMVELSLAGK